MKNCRLVLPIVALLSVSPVVASEKSEARFKGIASLHKLSSKSRNYNAQVAYPAFRSRTPLARFANARVKFLQRHGYFKWLSQTKKDLQRASGENSVGALPYEYESNPSLNYYSPSRLISLQLVSYQFLGGAHGSSSFQNYNFAMVGGKPKELKLADLFVPGTDYRKIVETRVFANLKKNESATWVQDGSVKKLTPEQFNNFSIGRDGITWLFNEYEMGPYANGQIEAKLSASELGPGFKRSLMPR
jgi:hypothetical protein